MKTLIVEGPDGAGKSTLVEAFKVSHPTVETCHPGKPPTSYKSLLAMLNEQLNHSTDNLLIYDRMTCISEWIYRPFRLSFSKNSTNESASYLSMLEAQMGLALGMDCTVIYCRPSIPDILENCRMFGEHDTEETIRVVEKNITKIVIAYDALMARLKNFGCDVIKYDYTKANSHNFIQTVIGPNNESRNN